MTVLYDNTCDFCRKARRFFERIDFDNLYHWMPNQLVGAQHAVPEDTLPEKMHLRADGKTYAGFEALKMILLYNPVSYFLADVILIVVMAPQLSILPYRGWIVAALLLPFSPPFSPVGRAIYKLMAQNRHKDATKRIDVC
jgi:predicted DCC family thiol-disulfide oxidoreductase YuxK